MESIDTSLKNWIEEEKKIYEGIAKHLSAYDSLSMQSLAAIVAALCNVHVEAMLTSKKHSYLYVRWLFFYAYRYFTNSTYDKMLHVFQLNGLDTTYYAVFSGISKMDGMIETEKYWKHRWGILKKIINEKTEGDAHATIEIEKSEKNIIIVIPKDLKQRVKIKEL